MSAAQRKPKFEKVKHHPLKRWRFEHDMGLEELAKHLGSTQAYLSMIEARKKVPSMKFAQKVCDLTGLSVNDFAP